MTALIETATTQPILNPVDQNIEFRREDSTLSVTLIISSVKPLTSITGQTTMLISAPPVHNLWHSDMRNKNNHSAKANA
jgi:hypothetical protein